MREHRQLRGAVWAIVCGAVLLVCAAPLVRASDEPSLWVKPGALTKRLLEDNVQYGKKQSDPECLDTTTEQVLERLASLPVPPGISPVYGTQYNDCWMVQSGGKYASGGTGAIQLNGLGSMLRLADPYFSYTIAGNKVIKWGGGPVSWHGNLRVFPNPTASAVIPTSSNVQLTVGFTNTSDSWLLVDPGTSDNTNIRSQIISSNGTWLVASATWGLIRVNLDTKEVVPFDVAFDGDYGFSVSDNGRYIITAKDYVYTLYDLATCDMRDLGVRKIAPGCGKRNISRDLMPTDATTHISTIRFNALADGLTYFAKENNVWKRYSLTAPGKAEYGMEYLALGDSYVSGEGEGDGAHYYVPGTDGDGKVVPLFNTGIANYPYDKEKCHLSSRSYPFLLAGFGNLHSDGFRSVACSGADANDVGNTVTNDDAVKRLNGHFDILRDFTSSQVASIKTKAIDNFIPGRAAQIEFVAKYKPKVLTIGLGGNDINFVGKLEECITSVDTCRYASTDKTELVSELKNSVYTRLGELLRRIKAASPATRIYMVGYPQVFGTGECNTNVWLNTTEQAYVRNAVMYLNDVIEATAASAGVNYLDIEHALDGVNLCSGQKYPAINGLTAGNDKLFFLGNETYHPNEQGHALVAAVLKAAMKDASIVDYRPCANPTVLHCNTSSSQFPSPPVYFQSGSGSQALVVRAQVTQLTPDDSVVAITGGDVKIAFANSSELLAPQTNVTVLLKSTPVDLSPAVQLTTDKTGALKTSLKIPSTVQPGIHTLHLVGTQRSGEPIDLYQTVVIAASTNDYDGDGIANAEDACQFVTPSGVDSDDDGIDDACEGDQRPHIKPIIPVPVPQPPAPVETPPTVVPTQPGAVLGVTTGAMTPYQGPIAVVRQPIGGNGSGDSLQEETIADSAEKSTESSDASARTATGSHEAANRHPGTRRGLEQYIWYGAGGIVILLVGGIVFYRLKR